MMSQQLQELIQLPLPPPPPSPFPPATKKNDCIHRLLPSPSPKVLLIHRNLQPLPSPSPGRRTPPSAAASPGRGQPLIRKERPRCGEVAGGTAAGCAAVCCCCPIGLVNLLVLVVVRLPAGLCRRAIKKRRKRKKAGMLRSRLSSFDDDDFGMPSVVPLAPESWPAKSPAMEVLEKEGEMWAQFYSAGFWRSQSQTQRE